MADFKTTLERLSRQEIKYEAVARNITKLLSKKPYAAVDVMEQLKQAVTQDVIDTDTYTRLKALVTDHLEAPATSVASDRTEFGNETSDDLFDITGGHDDATQIAASENPDATLVLSGDDATQIISNDTSDATSVDFDLSTDTGESSWPSGSANTGQTGTDWAQPGSGGDATQLGPGAILRGRFQLDEVLGVGGMGSVYLGSDLIKVRAKDKQPRVALKVLNEDFKQHPDSFIALQREASRQQKLAHPNIATVYDFDQTEDGLAFLVMELLEGQALNDFIKKVVKPKSGLPFEQALPMVQGLGNALIYAHERNIVHSDFKPGNCFITKEDQMKVLDFGIARAVKAPGAAEGETTIFDPGKLGALTPAYASVEMLEGEEPDTRDDIYALACVAYELLTGKHPFNKIPANKARDSGLAPEPIKTITRKQWRGLERGLAFLREDRSQSTAEFLEEFEGATSPFRNPFIMVPAAAALIVLAGFFPAKNYLDEQDTLTRINDAKSGDGTQIETVLSNFDVDGLADAKRDRILTEAKDEILNHFDLKAREQINIERGNFDFTGARRTLERAKSFAVYADSSKLAELEQYINEAENRLFAEQFDKFNVALENGALLAVDDEDDIFDAMAVVEKVDPAHPMLNDRRIPGAFAQAINTALENEDYDYADELGQVGLGLIPDSANLTNLTDKIAGAKDRAETRQRILTAIAAIQAARDSGDGLAAYVGVGDAIASLAAADPGNQLLGELKADITPLAERDLKTLGATKQWGKSALMTGNFNGMLRGLGLHQMNLEANQLGEEFDQIVAAARAEVTTAVAAGELNPQAEQALAKLVNTAPVNPRTDNARDQLALAHLNKAVLARDAGDYNKAEQALSQAGATAPTSALGELINNEQTRVTAEQALDEAGQASAREGRVAQFEQDFPAFATSVDNLGNDPQAYLDALTQLRALTVLNPADARLEETRNKLIAAIQSGVDAMAAADAWNNAVDIVRAGLVNMPQSTTLATRVGDLEAQRKEAIAAQQRQLVADSKSDIDELLQTPTADRGWRASVRQKMEIIAALGEPDDPWLSENGARIAEIYVQRASEMRAEQRLAEGANLLTDAERFAPDAPGLAAEREALAAATEAFEKEQAEQARLARIDGLKQTFESQARANDVANATKTLTALRGELGDDEDSFVDNEAPRMLASAYYKLATTRAVAADFAAALRFAKACADLQPQRLDCKNAVRDYTVDGNRQELKKIFQRGGEFDLAEVMAKISEVQILDPGVFSEAEGEWATAITGRIEGLKETAGTGANDVIEQAKTLFAGNQVIAAIEPVRLEVAASRFAADVNAAMDKALLGKARDLLKEASKTEAEHPDIVRLKGAYNARVGEAKALYEDYKQAYSGGNYESALEIMEKALTVWSDSSTFKREHARVVAKARPTITDGATTAVTVDPPIPATKPCKANLAGHGKRKKGTCFYYVSGNKRGPLMVVVPAGGEVASSFAIGKYEITVADFNRYCALSGECKIVDREGRLPMTDISLTQAEAYIAWLNSRTGLKFRLPTSAEWDYAANAAGAQPKKDYNCRVEQGGQLLKGQGTMGVNTGKANGWGLYNYVGNVQEWVSSGSGVNARGGAYLDAFSKCGIELEKDHDGSADNVTGFRVLLELDQG